MIGNYYFTFPAEATVEVPSIPAFWDRVELAWTILRGHKFLITGQRMDITLTEASHE